MSSNTVTLVASGDLRLSANQNCWDAQEQVEGALTRALEEAGYRVERGHPFMEEKKHGFLDSQRYGIDVFRTIDPDQALIVACAAWQYSHHVLPGLTTHRGPILTCANWSGTWPGLVGMLNLNGCLTKAGVSYSTLWSRDFTDEWFCDRLQKWLKDGKVVHDTEHVQRVSDLDLASEASALGEQVAQNLVQDKAILGVFDEGCMGMYNAIIPDHMLQAMGIFKERLSQSALYYETTQVDDEEAERCFKWLTDRGMQFRFGSNEEQDLTKNQVLQQLKMYVAALRIADDFGCDAIGIQYQQGLKDLLPASDLAEGLLNNVRRPPAYSRNGDRELFTGAALPHFNEVDECAGLDALVTNRIWNALEYDPETTLHDVRWGEEYDGEFIWTLEISGAVPANHFENGYASAVSERQPPMYFHLGGGTLKGVSKPGSVVWSRVYVADGGLKADLGLAEAVELPAEEQARRWELTTSQWPVMHARICGVSRDQMMAQHKSNHIQVAYAPDDEAARQGLVAKASAFQALGIETSLAGVTLDEYTTS